MVTKLNHCRRKTCDDKRRSSDIGVRWSSKLLCSVDNSYFIFTVLVPWEASTYQPWRVARIRLRSKWVKKKYQMIHVHLWFSFLLGELVCACISTYLLLLYSLLSNSTSSQLCIWFQSWQKPFPFPLLIFQQSLIVPAIAFVYVKQQFSSVSWNEMVLASVVRYKL